MPRPHNVTPELVEGIRLRHLLSTPTKRIPWCDYCNRTMFQFLATHRLCPRNSGRDITDLAVAMGCTHAGFEEAVWPRIKSSLRRKLAELHRDGNIVIYNDDDGVERAYWPAEAELWRRDNWDGRRDCRVPPLIREQLEAYGTLSDVGRDPRRRAGANVFERTSGRRHSQSTVVPSREASPAGERESTGGTRDSELAEPGVPAPSALSDDGSRRLSVLSRSDGLPASALSDDDSSPPSALSSDTASVALAMSAMDIDPPPAAVDSNRVLSDSQFRELLRLLRRQRSQGGRRQARSLRSRRWQV